MDSKIYLDYHDFKNSIVLIITKLTKHIVLIPGQCLKEILVMWEFKY